MGWAGAFWAAFLSVGVLYLTFFSGDASPWQVLRLRIQGVRAPAMVTAVLPTGTVFEGERLARIAYVYEDGAESRSGLAYDRQSLWSVGDAGTAVYVPGTEVRRLQGPGQQPYGLFGWIQWVLPICALVLGSTAWRRGIDAWLLLKHGRPATARVTNVWKLRFKARFRIAYRFEDDQGRQRVGWSDLPADSLPGGQEVGILYVPRQSAISAAVDALEWRFPLAVDGKGRLRYTGGALPMLRFVAALALLALAALAGGAHLAGFLPDLGR
jgi:hypothetical protein